jgi:hypothetical protein
MFLHDNFQEEGYRTKLYDKTVIIIPQNIVFLFHIKQFTYLLEVILE